MSSNLNIAYFCNYDDQNLDSDDQVAANLLTGKWEVNKDIAQQILSKLPSSESILGFIKNNREDGTFIKDVLNLSICSLLHFIDINYNTNPGDFNLEEYFGKDWPAGVDASLLLQRDSEPMYVNIKLPQLLYLSIQIFDALYSVDDNLLHLTWNFRAKATHQRILEDTSATLYSELELLIAKLSNETQNSDFLKTNPRLKVLLLTEISQAYLLYRRIQKVEEYLLKARELAGLKLELTGVLGKRTKFQQNALPQLALSSELEQHLGRPSAEESHGTSDLPEDIELQDDVRLNRIAYNEKIEQADLPSLEQTLCLLTIQYIQRSQPKDDLMEEELKPYIEAILSQKRGPWSTRVAALLIRCKIEANHKRTVERSMQQCEAIVNDKTGVSPTSRLSYIWASGLEPCWCWSRELAALYASLGLVKAALQLYKQLQLWEDVIVCYTILQLRHKAAEVIQEQINIKPTVKLYCLLGDATDDVSQYEKAWQFSKGKSSRAQRHWGNYLFGHKRYDDCIPHFEKSLDINSIQERVWLRLGFAALETGNWELSAKAYRRYTYLNPNSFEAWNNLAKVYVQQGDKGRAYRALIESLRFNYDNWKVWENVIIISMDTGHFEDVIRGAHRLLDLRKQYRDAPLLGLLVRAVNEGLKGADGLGADRLRKRVMELFGRITSVHQTEPELWLLYADVSHTHLLKAQRLLKAYKSYTMNGTWSNNPKTCKEVIEMTLLLLEHSLKARQEADEKDRLQADEQLSSARLTGQAVLRTAQKQDWPETQTAIEELSQKFNDVTEYIKSLL